MKRISFDLDDTLICPEHHVPKEKDKVPFMFKCFFTEKLRLGSVELFKELKDNGDEVWIYTTSYRSTLYLNLWFYFYGIKIDYIINQKIHLENFGYSSPSKNPRSFDIDLHIDDAEGVKLEGEKYGFRVLVISPDDLYWTEKVKNAISDL